MPAISERARQFKKFVTRSIVYPLVILTLFAAIIAWRLFFVLDASRWVDHSDKVIAAANYTLLLAIDEETGERGYFVNGNTSYLDHYKLASSAIEPAFARLSQMVEETPDQFKRVAEMHDAYEQWQSEATYELNLSSAYPGSYRAYFDQGREKQLMDILRVNFEDFLTSENSLRDQRAASAESAAGVTLIFAALLAILFALGLSLAWIKHTQEFAGQYEEALTVSQRNVTLLSTTLMSIGDAVLVTDARGKVQQMNNVAETLTGWKFADAYAMDANAVFKTVDRTTRARLESPINRVAEEGSTVALSDQAILIRQDGKELFIEDSCSAIRNDAGRVVGVVLVFRDVTERQRAEEEVSRLYEREHRIAENLQRSLLSKPDPSLFPKLDIETLYQPAWAEAKVGGDYFDIVGLKDGKACLIVGDVSGKGLKAASRTAEMKFTFRAYLLEGGDVADAVSRLNQFACQSISVREDSSTFFLCLTAIVIDPDTGEVTACVCGAEPPLIVRKNGEVEEIDASGAPIGIFESSEYAATQARLCEGDMIVIATDGITEARRAGMFLGNNGLAQFASNAITVLDLPQVGQMILGDVKNFANNQLSDDVCLLIARRK